VLAGTTSAGPSPGPGTPAPGPSPGPSTTQPASGYLQLAPAKLVLTSLSGHPVSGIFVLTAMDGPVPQYVAGVVGVPGGVKVAPASGSLPLNGTVRVTVTVTSKVALTTHVIVEPGNLTVTVVYTVKPPPRP